MSLKTWVTRPKKPFDSFYCYDTERRDFVRIRLELERKGDNPDPGVFARRNRYVGFVDDTSLFDFKDYNRWTVNAENKIVYDAGKNHSITLPNEPVAGKKVIDFSLDADASHPTFIHHGNAVTGEPHLFPENNKHERVTEKILKAIAENELGSNGNIKLCNSTATENELADAIFSLYHHIILLPQD